MIRHLFFTLFFFGVLVACIFFGGNVVAYHKHQQHCQEEYALFELYVQGHARFLEKRKELDDTCTFLEAFGTPVEHPTIVELRCESTWYSKWIHFFSDMYEMRVTHSPCHFWLHDDADVPKGKQPLPRFLLL